jgi:hypothetical protein
VRDSRERGNFFRTVNRSAFGRLGQRQGRGVDLMRQVARIARNGDFDGLRHQLAILAGQFEQLQAAAEEFRRPALVGDDMCVGMTEHPAPGWRHMGEPQRVGRGSRWYQEDRHIRFEQLVEATFHVAGEAIVPITEREASRRLADRLQNTRRNAGRVVARKIHGNFRRS